MFARRAGWDLAPSPLAARVAERRKRGLPLLDLSTSNPTEVGLEAPGAALAEALAALARDPALRAYAPDPRGAALAREAIAAYHAGAGASVSPEHVILSAGTSEGYAHLFRLLADPGERVHVPSPGYPLFEHLAALEGLEAATYPLLPTRGNARWRIDCDALEASLGPPSRAVLVIHPHNPTGSFVAPGDLARLRAVGRERGLALISDEVFAGSGSGASPPSALVGAEAGPLHFVLSGASKLLALPQLKLAWIVVAGPPAARDGALARLEFVADAYLSVSPLLARLLPELLARREELATPLRARVAANRARLAALDASGPVSALPAEAGWAAILRVRGPLDAEALALGLLERAVLVQPGFLFDLEDEPGSAQLVVSLLPAPADFARGLDALVAFASELA
jgi:aspartate/methionine/tyrosine aminotransferase